MIEGCEHDRKLPKTSEMEVVQVKMRPEEEVMGYEEYTELWGSRPGELILVYCLVSATHQRIRPSPKLSSERFKRAPGLEPLF